VQANFRVVQPKPGFTGIFAGLAMCKKRQLQGKFKIAGWTGFAAANKVEA